MPSNKRGRLGHLGASSRDMKRGNNPLRDGACAYLEVSAKRGPATLERALAGVTDYQRTLVPESFVQQLRQEAATRIKH